MSTVIQATEANVPAAVVQGPPSHSISEATYISAMTSAFVSNTYAIQQELATALSVFHEAGNVGREAKQRLMRIYGHAGWACLSPEGADYKTCSRRVNVGALLYTHLTGELIGKWCEGKMEMMLISSIVDGISPYGIKTIDGCLAFVGKPRTTVKKSPTVIEPPAAAPTAPVPEVTVPPAAVVDENLAAGVVPTQEQLYTEWLMHRGETPLLNKRLMEEGFRHIETEFVSVNVSVHATKDSLIEMAMKLMELASAMDGPHGAPIEENPLVTGEIPSSLLKETAERLAPVVEPTPLRAALEAALTALDEVTETPEQIASHMAQEAAAQAEREKAERVAASPSARYRKPSDKKTPKV